MSLPRNGLTLIRGDAPQKNVPPEEDSSIEGVPMPPGMSAVTFVDEGSPDFIVTGWRTSEAGWKYTRQRQVGVDELAEAASTPGRLRILTTWPFGHEQETQRLLDDLGPAFFEHLREWQPGQPTSPHVRLLRAGDTESAY